MIIDLNKTHSIFTDVSIKVNQTRLLVDNEIQVVLLSCKTLYFKNNIDITEQFNPKLIELIADNTTTQTMPDNSELGMYDFLVSYMSQPTAINDLISYYVLKNKDKF